MFTPTAHEMHLVETDPTGTELWECAQCGRRLLIRWPPAYAYTVLAAGRPQTPHFLRRGGLVVEADTLTAQRAEALADAWRLSAWDHWLTDIDFSDLQLAADEA